MNQNIAFGWALKICFQVDMSMWYYVWLRQLQFYDSEVGYFVGVDLEYADTI